MERFDAIQCFLPVSTPFRTKVFLLQQHFLHARPRALNHAGGLRFLENNHFNDMIRVRHTPGKDIRLSRRMTGGRRQFIDDLISPGPFLINVRRFKTPVLKTLMPVA